MAINAIRKDAKNSGRSDWPQFPAPGVKGASEPEAVERGNIVITYTIHVRCPECPGVAEVVNLNMNAILINNKTLSK